MTRKRATNTKQLRFFWVIGILALLVSGSMVGWMVYKYRETSNWANSSLSTPLAQVPPEWTRNRYSLGMAHDMNAFNEVTRSLNQINGQVTDEQITSMRNALKTGESLLERYRIEGGQAYETIQSLRDHVAIYDLLKTGYKEPNIDQFNALYPKGSEKEKQSLSQLAKDYNHLRDFLVLYTDTLGIPEDGILYISVRTTSTDQLVQMIEDNNLKKFPAVKTLYQFLTSEDWQTVLDKNKAYEAHETWLKQWDQFNSIVQTDYITIDDLYTLEDAEAFGLTIDAVTREGYDILKSSRVTKVTVNGREAKSGQYANKNAQIIVTIDPLYRPINEVKEDTEETVDEDLEETPHDPDSESIEERVIEQDGRE